MDEMEGEKNKMSKRKTVYARKIKRAAHLLFFKRHRKPGVKGWELKKKIGSDYPKVLEILNRHIEKLDLQIKTVFEEKGTSEPGVPSRENLDKARFYVTLKGGLTPKETKMMGWRIDDIAGLAITITYIISRKGKAPREEVEKLLKEKLPGWRAEINLNKYIRTGYIAEDENGQLYLDWRTRAEVDQKELLNILLGTENTNEIEKEQS